jgi:hypothetical protein
VLRGMQLYRRRLIAYSLGNLSGWRNFATGGILSHSALLTAELAPNGRLTGGRVTSLLLDRVGVPHVDPARSSERLMRRLSRSDFGASGVWFEPLGTLQPQPAAGLG